MEALGERVSSLSSFVAWLSLSVSSRYLSVLFVAPGVSFSAGSFVH